MSDGLRQYVMTSAFLSALLGLLRLSGVPIDLWVILLPMTVVVAVLLLVWVSYDVACVRTYLMRRREQKDD